LLFAIAGLGTGFFNTLYPYWPRGERQLSQVMLWVTEKTPVNPDPKKETVKNELSLS